LQNYGDSGHGNDPPQKQQSIEVQIHGKQKEQCLHLKQMDFAERR